MTQIVLTHDDGSKQTVHADLHNGYLVIPDTKIPFLDEARLEHLNAKERKQIEAQIEAARLEPAKLTELWQDGSILSLTHERPNIKFDYMDFLRKFQNHHFFEQPITEALSPTEREYILCSMDLDIFEDMPSIVVSLLHSLSSTRVEKINPSKIAEFVLHHGTAANMREFLALLPEPKRLELIQKENYAFLLDAMSGNKKEMIAALSECLPAANQAGMPTELQLEILKATVGQPLHPAFHKEVFSAMLPITMAACKTEGNTGAIEHAYKLAVLFSKSNNAFTYLQKWTDSKRANSRQPLHDAVLFSLPSKTDQYDSAAWEKFAITYGPDVLKHFGNAPRIEDAVTQMNEAAAAANEPIIDFAHANPRFLDKASHTLSYVRFSDNPNWGHLCSSLSLSEKIFDRGLEIFEHIKTVDNTPDIGIIDGAKLGKPGYYMRRLAADDPRNLLIGKLVNCCNHIDNGFTSYMAEAHVTSPDAACYVIFKEAEKGKRNDELDKPVAKSTGWMSVQNNFVFNSWERLSDDYTPLCEPFFSEAGRRILKNDPTIGRVLLGRNRDFIDEFIQVAHSEMPRSKYTASDDSDTQYLIAEQVRDPSIVAAFKQKINEPQKSLRKTILDTVPTLGLTKTQAARFEKRLAQMEPEIKEIEYYVLARRRMVQDEESPSEKKEILKDFGDSVDSKLDDIRDLLYKEYGFGVEDRRQATSYIAHMAIEYALKDVMPARVDIDDMLEYPYNASIDAARKSIKELGGSMSTMEYMGNHPKKFAVKAGIVLALGLGGKEGCQSINKDKSDRIAQEKFAIKREQENPGIFREACNVRWVDQFKDIDITDPKAVRAKFGDSVTVDDIKMPVKTFVEKVAPSLNILEEIRKKTPPDQWKVKSSETQAKQTEK